MNCYEINIINSPPTDTQIAPLTDTFEWMWATSDWILAFAQRFLGLPRGKHCMLQEGNIRRKVVSISKRKVFNRLSLSSPQFYHKWIKIMLIRWKCKDCKSLLESPRRVKHTSKNWKGFSELFLGNLWLTSLNFENIMRYQVYNKPCAWRKVDRYIF